MRSRDRHGPKIAVLLYNALRYGMDYVDLGASALPDASGQKLHRREGIRLCSTPLEPKVGVAVS